MGYVDILYWKLAIALGVLGIFFFFMTAEGLVNGKFRLPAWVFSVFTLTIGIFFFHTFLNSMAEFRYGSHETIDEMFRAARIIGNFLS